MAKTTKRTKPVDIFATEVENEQNVVEVIEEVAAPSIFASLVAPIIAAPVVEDKPKADRVKLDRSLKVYVTGKGFAFTPANTKPQDTETWNTIKDAVLSSEVPLADIYALVPTHKSYVGYALRRGWLAVV